MFGPWNRKDRADEYAESTMPLSGIMQPAGELHYSICKQAGEMWERVGNISLDEIL
jgi:hypothetical protein